MRLPLPKSLHGFLLVGISLITVPLLAGIGQAAIEMSRLATYGESLGHDSVATAGAMQSMFEQRVALERAAWYYIVLRRDTSLALFDQADVRLRAAVIELRGLLRTDATRSALDPFVTLQADIVRQVHAVSTTGDETATGVSHLTVPDFNPLNDQAFRVISVVKNQINSELASLSDQTNRARREVFWIASMMIPLFVAATLIFVLSIGRPLRQVDRAITELGGGNFTREIEVSGPVDLRRLGEQLEWLRSRLVELAQERNRFLRHMSHELKTPLANIREGTELLMDGAVGALGTGQREVTAILQDNSIKLQRMIENLLSFSAWQSNSTGLDPSEFRIRPVVKQVLENQQLTLVSQRLRLDVKIDDIALLADRGKLRLILENLLSNAIKYSPRGGTITVRARASEADLILEVADGGAGIAPADRPKIFEAFHTGRAPGGHVRGTGIGLSVVQEFVQAHRGTVEIVDGEFKGAHFRIRMPQRATIPPLTAGSAAAASAAVRRKAHAA